MIIAESEVGGVSHINVFVSSLMHWICSNNNYNCYEYIYVIAKCLLPQAKMAGASERHPYHNNDTSSDTEDYNDDRRRRVFKNRMRSIAFTFFKLYHSLITILTNSFSPSRQIEFQSCLFCFLCKQPNMGCLVSRY